MKYNNSSKNFGKKWEANKLNNGKKKSISLTWLLEKVLLILPLGAPKVSV